MAVNAAVAKAYASRYTRSQIEAALDAALADHAANVVLTSVNMASHGSSGQINGRTEDVIETLTAALDYVKGTTTSLDPEPIATSWNFSARRCEN